MIYSSIKEFVLSMNNTGYITFKDGENSFKEVVVSATSKETLSCELKRCFPRNENEHEYSYEMIYCFYQFYPNETVCPNDTYVGKIDLEIKDDEVLSVKSSLTLKEVDETLNLNLANEKKIEQIREGYLEAYKFLEDLSNKIDEKISQDEDLKDIILTPTNPVPFQLNYGLPELYPQSLHRPIKHIDKLLQSNVLHKLEYKEKLTKFNKLSQSEILTFLSSLRNNCMFGNNTNAEANVDKIIQTFIQKSDCDNMKNGIYIKPILIVKSIKGPNQGLVKIYDLLKHGYELNTYYNIEVK